MTFTASDRKRFELRPGDLLVCEGGEPGRAAVWNGELNNCYFQKALHRVRPYGDDSTRYLMWALRVLSERGAFRSDGPGRYTHLPAEQLRAVRVPLPSPETQRARLAGIDAEARRAQQVEQATSSFLTRLREYREALITEAVTGQLQVTNISQAQMDERARAALAGVST
jgi:type I restriction enzyme S subunit